MSHEQRSRSFPHALRLAGLFALVTLLVGLVGPQLPAPIAAAFSQNPATVFINEVHYDNTGSDSGEFIEVAGPAGTDLTGWSIVLYNGGNSLLYDTDALNGSIPDLGGGFGVVVVNYPSNGIQNGNPDGFALVNNGTVVQFLSYEGSFTAADGPAAGITSTDIGIAQAGTEPIGVSLHLTGSGSVYADFTWAATSSNTNGAINAGQTLTTGDAAPSLSSSTPADGAVSVPLNSTVTLNFSEPVDLTVNAVALECPVATAITVSGLPATNTSSVILTPSSDLPENTNCTVTLSAAEVTDTDAADPPNTLAEDVSFSFTTTAPAGVCPVAPVSAPLLAVGAVQTAGMTAISGSATVRGIVTGFYGNGFYVQDAGDADPATSDGIYVFTASAPTVAVGEQVQVTGPVSEFSEQSQFSNATVNACDTGVTLPAAVEVTLPVESTTFLERYEGMLVTFPQTLTAQQNFFQGRFGQVTLGPDRLYQPTNLFPAGSTGALALADLNARSLLVLDDGLSSQNPNPIPYLGADDTLRAGDTTTGLTGVLDYGPINSNTAIRNYRVQPTAAVEFTRVNARSAVPPQVGGDVKIASFNVLNYFTTIDQTGAQCFPSGTRSDCRGADSVTEFERQQAKLVAAIVAMDADVVGVIEIENNGAEAISALADALNAATAPGTYAPVADPSSGAGFDAIKVGLIYKPGRVSLSGQSLSDPDPIFDRPPVAQSFVDNRSGEQFSVVVNHFKSKGSCPASGDPNADQGDGQSCWNVRRVEQAQQLLVFIDTIQAATGDEDVIVIGDLNAYGFEDPILALTDAGLINQLAQRLETPYSYVFDGLAGYLDHALTTPGLDPYVSGVAEWHINADEPSVIDYNTEFKPQDVYAPTVFRSSDHDPVLIGLDFTPTTLSAAAIYDTGLADAGAEIISLRGDVAVLSNAGDGSVDILDTSDLLDISLIRRVKIAELAGLTSVAIHPTKDLFVAVAGESGQTRRGVLLAFRLSDGALLAQAEIGRQPDSVEISPDGNVAVIAVEAQQVSGSDDGGAGAIAVADLSSFDPATSTAISLDLVELPDISAVSGVSTGRIFAVSAAATVDNLPGTIEPEGLAFSPDGSSVFVTLQENNAIARLSLSDPLPATLDVANIFGLGQTTHLADLSDDGVVSFSESLTAYREPDGIRAIEIGGTLYLLTADEGDTNPAPRGGRTLSIFDAASGTFVADTGDQLDRMAARYGIYPDGRSDNGGVGPEMLDVASFGGKTWAVVGLEHANALAIVDVSTPSAPLVTGILPVGSAPEGVKLLERDGSLYALSANEGAGSVTTLRVPTGDALFTQNYTEDTALALHNPLLINPDLGSSVTVTLQLEPVTAGVLAAPPVAGATANFDPETGRWSANGNTLAVNGLLAGLVFTPTLEFSGVVTTTLSIEGGPSGLINLIGTPVNDAPTLTNVTTLSGAVATQPFTITYAMLRAASDAADIEGDELVFRIASVLSGSLTKDGVAVVPGVTTLAAGESLVFVGATANAALAAFTVVASDGTADSTPAVTVRITVTADNPPSDGSVLYLPFIANGS